MEKSKEQQLELLQSKQKWAQRYLMLLDAAERKKKMANKIHKKIDDKFRELIRSENDATQLTLFNPDDFMKDIRGEYGDEFGQDFWAEFENT